MRTLFILCKEIRHSLTSMITFNAQGALEKTFDLKLIEYFYFQDKIKCFTLGYLVR